MQSSKSLFHLKAMEGGPLHDKKYNDNIMNTRLIELMCGESVTLW